MAQNSKIWWSKKLLKVLTFQKLAPFGPANSQSVTYSKIQTKVCRTPYSTPMDRFLIKSMNPVYPLSCRKCVEKRTFCVLCPIGPPSVCHTPQKLYHLGICWPTTPRHFEALSLLHQEKNRFSEGIFFWQITWMALQSPKIDIGQNWPRRVLGDVISCLESKFEKNIPMGSVSNCQKEIPNCHGIRWFNRLKPPKNPMKLKKFWSVGRARAGCAPPKSATEHFAHNYNCLRNSSYYK